MGFWSKLGKGLLKAAPFAAMAIPGIGPAASALIQGGLGAANAKAGGGGWKDVLLGGGLGAATSGVGGGAAKGLAPTSKGLGGILKETGKNVLTGGAGKFGAKEVLRNTPNLLRIFGGTPGDGQGEGNLGNSIGLPPGMMNLTGGTAIPRGPTKRQPGALTRAVNGTKPRMDIRNPNLAHPLLQGVNQGRAYHGLPPVDPTDYMGNSW